MEFVHGVSPADVDEEGNLDIKSQKRSLEHTEDQTEKTSLPDESTHQSNGAFKYDKMKAVELDNRDSPTEV